MSYIEEIQNIIDQHDFVEDALPLIDVSKVIEEVMDSGEGYQANAYLEPGYDSPENGKIITEVRERPRTFSAGMDSANRASGSYVVLHSP